MDTRGKGSVPTTRAVKTQGKGSVPAMRAVKTQGKGSVAGIRGVETEGKGIVPAIRTVKTQGKGSVASKRAVETQGKGSGSTKQRQCPSHNGSGSTSQKAASYHRQAGGVDPQPHPEPAVARPAADQRGLDGRGRTDRSRFSGGNGWLCGPRLVDVRAGGEQELDAAGALVARGQEERGYPAAFEVRALRSHRPRLSKRPHEHKRERQQKLSKGNERPK